MIDLKRFTLNGPTMGTRYSAVFYAPAAFDERDLALKLKTAVDAVDQQMSTWKPESDLSRLNAVPVGTWITIPPEMLRVLATALRIGQHSGGAFDVALGKQVAAWGFGAHKVTCAPPALASAYSPLAPGHAFELDTALGRARRCAPVSLDLSGIAKGFGVDELARVMKASGIQDWLVGIDGEMRACGTKPDGTTWAVGHERPIPGQREIMGVIELNDRSVATSGNYRHFRDKGGQRISHTIDPRTGRPIDNTVASVTVLAETCMEADAWATAFMVTGPEKGLRLAQLTGIDAIFVLANGSVRTNL